MSFLGLYGIDDFVTFPANTHNPTTGAAADATGSPAYRIYEDLTTAPILTGTMALQDGANTTGLYTARIQLTAANGFEVDKSYTIYIEATVAGVLGTMSHTLQIPKAVDVNVTQWGGLGSAVKTGATSGLPQTDPHGWQGEVIPTGNMIEDSGGARWTAKALETAPSGGGDFWSDAEQRQIRDALGVDGNKTPAQLGQLQNKAEPGNEMALVDNAITAAKVAASALNGKGDWNIGKTGYDLNADQTTVNINSADSVGSVTGNVAGSVNAVLQRVTANADQINGSATGALNLQRSTETILFGAAVAGTLTTTEMTTDLTVTVTNQYKDRTLVFLPTTTTAALRYAMKDITAVDTTGSKLIFTAMPAAPVAGDTFIII